MHDQQFSEVVDLIRKEDSRFAKGAYHFVRQALDHTIRHHDKSGRKRATRHVSGQELLEGIREYALEQYGPMARTLFAEWGITECRHFGEIVFQLVDYGVLGKTEDDRLEDFCDGYDFHEAFTVPFLPKNKPTGQTRRSASSHD